MRESNEQQLAMDGLFSQHDEVFVKIINRATGDIYVDVPQTAYHSAYPSQHLVCIPYCYPQPRTGKVYSNIAGLRINVPKGGASPKWVEVGSRMDTFNDGTWTFTAGNLAAAYACVGGQCVRQFGGNYTMTNCKGACKAPVPVPPKPGLFPPAFTIEFGVQQKGSIVSIGSFESTVSTPGRYGPVSSVEVAYDASTTTTMRMRKPDASLYTAVAEAKQGPVPHGSSPASLTPIYGYTFCSSDVIRAVEPACTLASSESPGWAPAIKEFNTMFPIVDASGYQDPRKALPSVLKDGRAYYEARAAIHNLTKLELMLQNFTAEGVADKVLVVSMGDEISLTVPTDPQVAQAEFVAWCKKKGVPVPGVYNVSWAPTGVANPTLFYYSNLFANQFGLDAMAGATALIRKYLRNANIGANYSPMTYGTGGYIQNIFFYPVNKAVTMFRQGAMTMPWGEDYTWQSPIGTQQMTTVLLDLFRAGVRKGTTKTTSQIMFYTLAHAPGNTATSWRRNFYNYLGHGMRILNLYEFRPCTASFTENYVDTGYGMYSAVRTALAELSLFEDITQNGAVVNGDVGLWCSDAFDVWGPATPPNLYGAHQNTFLAGKRSLFIAMLHAELAVDMVVEDDIGATLDTYKLIFLADTHVSAAAAVALAAWVKAGGILVATAGAGMQNEFNATNTAMQALLGVVSVAMVEPVESTIQFIKQDLRFSPPLGAVTWNGTAHGGDSYVNTAAALINGREVNTAPVIGARHVFNVANPRVNVTGWFTGSGEHVGASGALKDTAPQPASTVVEVGKGVVHYYGWLPGLAYFAPAIPVRPADRGGTDKAFTHFVPSNFSDSVLSLVASAAEAALVTRHVVCSNHLVHGRVVLATPSATSKTKGAVVSLTNWAGVPTIAGLSVTVQLPTATGVLRANLVATLASGGAVTHGPVTQATPTLSVVTFTLDLVRRLWPLIAVCQHGFCLWGSSFTCRVYSPGHIS